jgi:acetoin utilization protein AcuC
LTCSVGVVKGRELLSYSFPRPHPFTSERVAAFWERLDREVPERIESLKPEKADEAVIELFHSREHLEFVKRASEFGYGSLDQGDTPAFRGIFEAAQYTVGSTLACLKEVMDGEIDHSFNPVGGLHHATRDSSAGFCVFNDIGVAVEVLRSQYGVKRILYVDIDVHHGDGVYYPYESDADLYVFDVHEDGRFLYPGTGSESEVGMGLARGTKVNVPLPPGTGDEGIIETRSPA